MQGTPQDARAPDEEFHSWRIKQFKAFRKSVVDMGGLPVAALMFVPRMCLSNLIVAAASLARGVARLFGSSSSYQRKSNLRILIVTDYMPPQTHGIAIRFRQYIDHMRRQGHEVHVFCNDSVRRAATLLPAAPRD